MPPAAPSPTALGAEDGVVLSDPTIDSDPYHSLAPDNGPGPAELPALPTDQEPTGSDPYRSPWLKELSRGVVPGLTGEFVTGLVAAQSRIARKPDGVLPPHVFDGYHKHDWLLKGFYYVLKEVHPNPYVPPPPATLPHRLACLSCVASPALMD